MAPPIRTPPCGGRRGRYARRPPSQSPGPGPGAPGAGGPAHPCSSYARNSPHPRNSRKAGAEVIVWETPRRRERNLTKSPAGPVSGGLWIALGPPSGAVPPSPPPPPPPGLPEGWTSFHLTKLATPRNMTTVFSLQLPAAQFAGDPLRGQHGGRCPGRSGTWWVPAGPPAVLPGDSGESLRGWTPRLATSLPPGSGSDHLYNGFDRFPAFRTRHVAPPSRRPSATPWEFPGEPLPWAAMAGTIRRVG